MKRLLVTGAGGFVGQAVLPLLSHDKFEIHAISRRPVGTAGPLQWHPLDLENPAATRDLVHRLRPDVLLHLAWLTEPGSFWNSPANLDWMRGTIRLFEAFREAGGSRIVATGSCAEYDWTGGLCDEQTTPCRPNTLYGRAKLACATYLDTLNSDALRTAWARLFFLYGPGASEQRMPGVVLASLGRGEPARCSAGIQERDFSHIADVAAALVRILESDATGPVNICSGEPVTIRQLAETTARIVGREDLLKLGAVPTASHEPPRIVGTNARLRELGWSPHYPLEGGLRQTVETWKRRNLAASSG